MQVQSGSISGTVASLSLYQLYEPQVLANPYPLYHHLRSEDPVHWDPFLHAWVVTRYRDVATVLQNLSANCAPTPKRLAEMDLSSMNPIAATMIQQMLFMDPPRHVRLRALCSVAFTPHRVEALRSHIQDIVDRLLEPLLPAGHTDLMADFANRLPAIVTAEMLGLPPSDHEQLKSWSADFAEILGNFQHNPDSLGRMLRSLEEMTVYFRAVIRDDKVRNSGGLISALIAAELDGEKLSEDAIIANTILLMVGGQETTPNLIGNGLLSLLRNPDQLAQLRANPMLMPSAIEELLRYEAPSQHTTRITFEDMRLGDKLILKQQSVIAVMGAGNRDPGRFPDPDRLDIMRPDNRHLAFGAGGHFCFGASLARIEGQIAFTSILRRMSEIALESEDLVWRRNLGLRGLAALPLVFKASA
jgi:pimeloyl-[acyl-carrier protein] synthase